MGNSESLTKLVEQIVETTLEKDIFGIKNDDNVGKLVIVGDGTLLNVDFNLEENEERLIVSCLNSYIYNCTL